MSQLDLISCWLLNMAVSYHTKTRQSQVFKVSLNPLDDPILRQFNAWTIVFANHTKDINWASVLNIINFLNYPVKCKIVNFVTWWEQNQVPNNKSVWFNSFSDLKHFPFSAHQFHVAFRSKFSDGTWKWCINFVILQILLVPNLYRTFIPDCGGDSERKFGYFAFMW